MDVIIRQIIDIDKKADGILTETEEYIRDSEKNTKASIEKMRSDIISKAKSEANSRYDSILNEARAEAGRISALSEGECDDIGKRFANIKDTLEQDIFSKLIQVTRDVHD